MAICNLIGDLKKENGTFITFSQYLNDITRENVEGSNYRVVPSKFVCLDVHDGEIMNKLRVNVENAAALIRNGKVSGLASESPEWFRGLVWDAFMIKNVGGNTLPIRYMGDINMKTSNIHNGMNYAEILCHIPEDASLEEYTFSQIGGDIDIMCGETYEGYERYSDDIYKIPEGYHNITSNVSAVINEKSSDTPRMNFTFNTIIVLYDIETGVDTIKDIPMGVYFTGVLESRLDEDGNVIDWDITNAVTKVAATTESSTGIGTAYNLKICTRYVTTLDSTPIEIVESNNMDEWSEALAYLAQSQNKIFEVTNQMSSALQQCKSMLTTIKKHATNVPYIVKVKGVDWWFVNGKPMAKVYQQSNE